MRFLKGLCEILIVLGVAVALAAGLAVGSLHVYRYFAPQWQEAHTDVYRQTKSYVEGSIRDLRRLKREYETAEESHKPALRTMILQRSDELDWDNLPADLRRFVQELQ